MRALKSLNCDINVAGFVFAELLLIKIPSVTRDNINRASNTDTWDLSALRTAINDEIQHLYATQGNSKSPKGSTVYNNTNSKNFVSTASFNVLSQNKTFRCRYCEQYHSSNSCNTCKTVEQRTAKIKEIKLCFNCLKPKHSGSLCTNSGRCLKCARKHNTSLCPMQERVVSQPEAGGKTKEQSAQKKVGANINTDVNSNSTLTVQSKCYDEHCETGIFYTNSSK